jgi:meso-butanediol dehydrogenase / (S,S)-butanediol dehydrogenase / diacetyl reductase
MQLAGKVAIVTGAGSGIGQSAAMVFAEEGASVLVVDWCQENGEETVAAVRKNGHEAAFCYTDVSKARDVENMVEAALRHYGKIDVLLNNAAVQIMAKLVETKEEDWDRIHSVNLKGVFLCCKYAIPVMMRNGGGSIINMSSALGLVGDADLVAYGAAKGGIIALTKAAAIGYGPHGIRVNCICPGDVDTKLFKDYYSGLPDPEGFRQQVYSEYALRRIAEPREIARLALFLASDASSFMTGSALVIDGGLTSKCY